MGAGGEEVGIHGGVGGPVSGDDNVLGEPDAETGGDGGLRRQELPHSLK
jgi:hypothetical protein